MMGSQTEKIIEEVFKSFFQKYQEGLEESVKGSQFIFDNVDSLCYHFQKASVGRTGGSYIDSPKWLKNKKAAINPKDNNSKCFQYAIIAALNYKTSRNNT